MQLIYARPSPFVRKVMVVLEEAGVSDEVELVDGFGSPVSPNKTAITANPIGKIPCLVLDDGQALYDSRVITRYLDDRFQIGLHPDGGNNWSSLTLEAHADGMLDAAVISVYEVRCRDEQSRSPAWVSAQHDKIRRALDALENQWLDHLAGPLDMSHIGVGCVLGYLDLRREMGGWEDWREGRPGLTQWGNHFLQRPSMQATVPE